MQCIEIQIVVVKLKVNAEFAFTLNQLIYSLLRGEVKGEGKKGKFGECAGAYIRVGACPARRIESEFVWGREVLRETREEVAKSGEVLKESWLVFFERSGGGEEKQFACSVMLGRFCVVRLLFDFVLWLFRNGLLFFDPDCPVSVPPFSILILFRLWLDEKTPAFLFSSSAKVEFRAIWSKNLFVKLIFSAKTEISGENFSRAEEKNAPKRWFLPPKWPNGTKKGGFGEEIAGRG